VRTVAGTEEPPVQIHLRNISFTTMLVILSTLPFRQRSRIFILLSYSDNFYFLFWEGNYSPLAPPCSAAPMFEIYREYTWVLGNTRFISREHDWSHEWACSTREINLVFPSTHVFFCLLYKGHSLKSDNFYRKAIIFTCEIIINNLTCEIISFISARNLYKALYTLYNKIE
jgi:hypothetical protein